MGLVRLWGAIVPKPVKLKTLRKRLRKHGVDEDASRGKGSHTMFSKVIGGKVVSYPVPTDNEVEGCYISQLAKRFNLDVKDLASD